MKKIYSIFIVLALVQICYCQELSPFPYLDKIDVSNFEKTELYLNKNDAQIINRKRNELEPSHLFYAEECEGEYMTLVAICKIDNTSNEYAIVFGACPNPEFIIYNAKFPEKKIGTINANKLFITGNSSIYCSGGEGTFNAKRKYVIRKDSLIEIGQPFYYIGLKTKTLRPIKLYQSQDLENEIASLPVNYPVEIIASDKSFNETQGLYLVKTKFGLIGWAKLIAGQGNSIDIEGLLYRGD